MCKTFWYYLWTIINPYASTCLRSDCIATKSFYLLFTERAERHPILYLVCILHYLLQGHLASQPNAPRQDNYKQTPRDIQEQDLTSVCSGQRQDSAAIQQEANIKAQHIFGSCIMCGKFSLYLCSTCQNIWYCSQQCQVREIIRHLRQKTIFTGILTCSGTHYTSLNIMIL